MGEGDWGQAGLRRAFQAGRMDEDGLVETSRTHLPEITCWGTRSKERNGPQGLDYEEPCISGKGP